ERDELAIDGGGSALELRGDASGLRVAHQRIGNDGLHLPLDERRDLLLHEALLGQAKLAVSMSERRQHEYDGEHLPLGDLRLGAEHAPVCGGPALRDKSSPGSAAQHAEQCGASEGPPGLRARKTNGEANRRAGEVAAWGWFPGCVGSCWLRDGLE